MKDTNFISRQQWTTSQTKYIDMQYQYVTFTCYNHCKMTVKGSERPWCIIVS